MEPVLLLLKTPFPGTEDITSCSQVLRALPLPGAHTAVLGVLEWSSRRFLIPQFGWPTITLCTQEVVPRKAVSHWAQHGKMLQVPSEDVSPPLPPALFSRGISQPQPHLRKVSALPELAPGHLVSPLGRWWWPGPGFLCCCLLVAPPQSLSWGSRSGTGSGPGWCR